MAHRGCVEDGRRMITVCCAPARQRGVSAAYTVVCRPPGCPPRSWWWHNFTYTKECKIQVVDAIGPHRGLPASPVSQFAILSRPLSFDVDIFAQETPLILGLAGGQIEGIGIDIEA